MSTRLPTLDVIPAALHSSPHWVVFRFGARKANGKRDKIPYNPRTGEHAKTNDPTTWGTVEEALNAYNTGQEWDGVGFVFTTGAGVVGIDLDGCRDPHTGTLEPWATAIVQRIFSYTEASPSGTGVHVLARSHLPLPVHGRKNGQFEMYEDGRFFTITGQHLEGTPLTLEDRTAELAAVHADIFSAPAQTNGADPHRPLYGGNDLGNSVLIERARTARNGALFTQLWAGDWRGYASQSEGDQALCNLLAFWCGPDPARVDHLFRQSGLYREKWDEKHFSSGQTYGAATIAKAIRDARAYFSTPREERPYSGCETPHDALEAWPRLADEALYGLAGDIVSAIDPYTEADPVATLLNTLLAFGNCINATAHARIQHDVHPCRLFVVQVGDSSKGRKGTGWSTPRYLFALIDPDWTQSRVKSGLSSGEGLVYQVRDPHYAKVPRKEKGRFTGEYDTVCTDEGVADKRLLVFEPEFASVLTVIDREKNTLSTSIRQAWDSGHLSPMTKNNPIEATHAHISIVGHITKDELLKLLDDNEKANGFANRFLWALVRRSKELPEGGAAPDDVLQPLAERLRQASAFARATTEVQRDAEAKSLWAAVYHDLSEGRPGLLGAVLSRAEAQVLRLSVVYALLDQSPVVRVEHLKAALAVWEYCEQSAVFIFGKRLGDPTADRILDALRNASPQGMSENDIHELFGRNRSANERARALTLLQSRGLVKAEREETGGRPRTMWKATR